MFPTLFALVLSPDNPFYSFYVEITEAHDAELGFGLIGVQHRLTVFVDTNERETTITQEGDAFEASRQDAGSAMILGAVCDFGGRVKTQNQCSGFRLHQDDFLLCPQPASLKQYRYVVPVGFCIVWSYQYGPTILQLPFVVKTGVRFCAYR